jgi:hypothetical protein
MGMSTLNVLTTESTQIVVRTFGLFAKRRGCNAQGRHFAEGQQTR